MSASYFDTEEKKELLNTFMSRLVRDILREAGKDDRDLTDEERQDLGTSVSNEWASGKTSEEINDILLEKFGSEEEKEEYAAWKLSHVNTRQP